jgi:hypothetical protein
MLEEFYRQLVEFSGVIAGSPGGVLVPQLGHPAEIEYNLSPPAHTAIRFSFGVKNEGNKGQNFAGFAAVKSCPYSLSAA